MNEPDTRLTLMLSSSEATSKDDQKGDRIMPPHSYSQPPQFFKQR
ncbi:hypothetical protein ACQ4M4_16055 [Leptolyngbya sp. AN02str]